MSAPAEAWHLARRFAASLRPATPDAAEEQWARRWLSDAEWELWTRHSERDRVHTLAVARRVERAAADASEDVPPWVTVAALLHDVGKTTADLGVAGRVLAGVLRLVRVGHAPGRLGRYLVYPEAGAAMLQRAGSDPRVVAWAAEHHEAPPTWSVPAPWAARLAAADHAAV